MEIRALPYPEIRKWRLMYLIEPFGFENAEYRLAAILSQIYNTTVQKKSQAKGPKKFLRNIPREVIRYLKREQLRQNRPVHDLDTEEGRKAATEEIMANFRTTFGKRML